MESYRTYHWVFAGLLVFALFFPWVGDFLTSINENMTQCWYKQLTGNPCIFCGGTHAFKDWWAGRAPLMFKHAAVAVWWLVEILRHGVLLVSLYLRPKWFEGKRYWLWEGVVSALILIAGFLPLVLDIR